MLGRWTIPIYNDTYVMIFFGILKKLVGQYLTTDANEVRAYYMYICTCMYLCILVVCIAGIKIEVYMYILF